MLSKRPCKHVYIFLDVELLDSEPLSYIFIRTETMAIALQVLDIDVQLMILELVWKAECLYPFMH